MLGGEHFIHFKTIDASLNPRGYKRRGKEESIISSLIVTKMGVNEMIKN